jgi:hypothetical protein
MTTDPKNSASAGGPTNETLAAVLEELRQITRESSGKPREFPKVPPAKAPAAAGATPARPLAQQAARVSFPPARVPPPETPKSRARYWLIGGGVLVASAALAVPFRSVIFDVGGMGTKTAPATAAKAPWLPDTKASSAASSAPAKLASAPAPASTASAPAPVSAQPAAVSPKAADAKPVETKPVEIKPSESRTVEVASAASEILLRPVAPPSPGSTTASIAPAVHLEKTLPPVDPPPSLSLDRDLAKEPAKEPAKETARNEPKPPPVVAAAPTPPAPLPVPEPTPTVASVAPVPSASAANRPANTDGHQTRLAALGPIPESSATTAVIPAPAVPAPAKVSPDAERLMTRAQELIRSGDISAARLLLQRAMQTGSAQAAFQLAETYDPQILSKWGARGIRGDVERARELYSQALKGGVSDSTPRLEAPR